MSVIDSLNIFKIVNSQLDAFTAKRLQLGYGLFDGVLQNDTKKKAYIIDAILYKELQEPVSKEGDNRVNTVMGIGISINLLYTSLNLNSNISIPQLAASLRYGTKDTSMRIQGIGMGADGIREVIKAQISVNENRKISTIEDLSIILNNIQTNLVNYISDNKERLRPDLIKIVRNPSSMDDFLNTQSILYGLNNIIESQARDQLNVPAPFIPEMVDFIYKQILGQERYMVKPDATDIENARNYKYQ